MRSPWPSRFIRFYQVAGGTKQRIAAHVGFSCRSALKMRMAKESPLELQEEESVGANAMSPVKQRRAGQLPTPREGNTFVSVHKG